MMTTGSFAYGDRGSVLVAGETAPMARQQALWVDGLSVAYRDTLALEDVSIGLPSGQLVAIVGPNGQERARCSRAPWGWFGRYVAACSFLARTWHAFEGKSGMSRSESRWIGTFPRPSRMWS